MHGLIEDLPAGFAGILGAVHSNFSITKNAFGFGAGVIAERNSDTAGNNDLMAVQIKRRSEFVLDAFCNMQSVARVPQFFRNDDKLVTSGPGQTGAPDG